MGFLFDEKKFINDNVFLHEERISSPYARFLDSTPTYVTYYNINNIESTTDLGFGAIERLLGPNSPLRFNEVKDFPIYGIEQIVLSLSDELQGLDSSYDGEAVILPNTVKPLPNDMFIISYLNQNYIFMVTEIAYDTIKSNNFYKISFTAKYLDEGYRELLLNQTGDKFNCIVDNIGTQEKVLIKQDDVDQLIALNEIYTNIAEQYKIIFYNKKFNSFIYNVVGGYKVYDKYVTEFINKFQIFNENRTFDTVYLTNEDKTPMMQMEYHRSIYRAVEVHKKELVQPMMYGLSYITYPMSIFNYYRDSTARSIVIGSGPFEYVRGDLIQKINTTGDVTGENVLAKTIIDFFHDRVDNIYSLDRANLRNYLDYMMYDHETYILTPILLHILRFYYNKFMTTS